MKEADRVTKSDVLTLLEKRSSAGVVSVYIDLPASDRHDPGRLLLAVRSGLKTLAQTHGANKDVHNLLQVAQNEISSLPVDARHRSLVYFRSLNPDWQYWRSLQTPLTTLFAWDQIAQVRPLIAHLDEFPVLGVVALSQERARFFTWTEGKAEELPDMLLELMADDSRTLGAESPPVTPSVHPSSPGLPRPILSSGHASSPSTSAPNHAAVSKRRGEDRMRRFLQLTGRKIGEVGAKAGWQRLLLIGPPVTMAPVMEQLPDIWKRLLISSIDRNLIKSSLTEIAETSGRKLNDWKRRLESQDVDSLIEDARSGGRACLGLQATLDHLQQRRVERLLFCGDLQLNGFRDAGGGLHEHMLHAPGSVDPEPHLVERMITSALDSGATVIPLEGESSRQLALLGGVGARLRWKGANGGLFPEGRG